MLRACSLPVPHLLWSPDPLVAMPLWMTQPQHWLDQTRRLSSLLQSQNASDQTSESQASTPVGSSPCSPLNPHPRAHTAASPKYPQNAAEQEVDSPDRKSLEYSDVVVDENSLLEMEELALPTQAVIDSYYPWYPGMTQKTNVKCVAA
jgi:hypothetical protein